MIAPVHSLRLAFKNLRRGGQRVFVALLCIIFGVMSLVAMDMLSKSIERTLILQPAEILGGDLTMGLKEQEYILPEHEEQLKALQKSGEISRYTLIAYNSSLMFHTPGSGEMHFGTGYGVNPEEYPLAGALTIGQPGSIGLPTLLQQVGDLVITRDLAQQYRLKLGDPIVLADLSAGQPVQGVVRGIAYDTPNHQGSKIYYTAATAQKLAASAQVFTVAVLTASNPGPLSADLDQAGWFVSTAEFIAGGNKATTNLIMTGLRSAGILGLLVGGIGIANTMQVLLRRRQKEIAIWKALGYRESDLRVMFAVEAGLLGLAGSLMGAGLGVLISGQLLEMFRRTSNLLYEWSFSASPPLMGVLVGTLTTVLFAYWAIVISSQARPMALLRDEAIDVRRLPWWKSGALALLLAVPFTALTSLVMESVAVGIGVLAGIVVGIAVLGGFFSALLWACARLLPLRGFPIARMGLNSLRRRGASLVFAMIALFIGVLSMSMGMVVVDNGAREISARKIDIEGYNLNVLGLAEQENAILQAVQDLNPEKVAVGYRTQVSDVRVTGADQVNRIDKVLVGRTEPGEYSIHGAPWGSRPGGVYVDAFPDPEDGAQVEVTFTDGSTQLFPIVGTYSIQYSGATLLPPDGLLMDAETFKNVANPESITAFVRVAPDQVEAASNALGEALPQATVINLVAYASRFIQSYQNLFVLAMAMAGLALLAGVLLVANSVSLAMLDRSHEIGVLKAVGYSRRQVLAIFAVEYGLVGVLATGMGVLTVQVMLGGLAIANHVAAALLLLTPASIALAAVCGVGLILLTVVGVAWRPTQVSPVFILNERNG